MESIVHIGLDVHTDSVTAVAFLPESNLYTFSHTFAPTQHNFEKYVQKIRTAYPNYIIKAGYEAGCLGFVPFHMLNNLGVLCDVIAPTSILADKSKVKTDKRDARFIATTLAHGTYKPVYIPTPFEHEVRAYLHMREDVSHRFKMIKQQINSFCVHNGLNFDGTKTKWTRAHITWLKKLVLSPLLQETLNEYLEELFHAQDKLARIDENIQKLAAFPELQESIGKYRCFKGIDTLFAMTIRTELGDLNRFKSAAAICAYVGLIPSEHSSNKSVNRMGITKAGNSRVRKALIEAAQKYGQGAIGRKSKKLRARQEGQSAEVIGFTDRVSQRLSKKYREMSLRGKSNNVIKVAIARRLLEYIWALETGRTEPRAKSRII